jgi:hypothetical protein
MTSKEIAIIKEVIKTLNETPCSFWGCEGVKSKEREPILCTICHSVNELQKLL